MVYFRLEKKAEKQKSRKADELREQYFPFSSVTNSHRGPSKEEIRYNREFVVTTAPVSYTHLTLPTIYSV